ncbi:MAG: pyrroloquinoline quinone precursor peptide PqqA [Streptosporangiales bacterium]|jgi:coenzyme PQQ precursor peptide PqqA|nr:pyrroloquinoline quinone precursor peptide PqqA [Streptosporangiales bacterium]
MPTESETARPAWETPDCEQISVSAEVTAYMGRS